MEHARPSDERRRLISAYAIKRLQAERAREPRGFLARVAKSTGFTPAHISTVANGSKSVGEDLAAALARFWGFSSYEAMAEAARSSASNAGDPVASLAHELLERAAKGLPDWEPVADELVQAVLSRRDVALALQVGSGGQFRLARAIELATLILDTSDKPKPAKTARR